MIEYPEMFDSANPDSLPADASEAIAGYFGGPNAYNVWPAGAWGRFARQRKLPIWVAGLDGAGEGRQAATVLLDLAVPVGAYIAVDMEGRRDITYLDAFYGVVRSAGWRVWVYGSASTVFGNPQLNGYWVADYAGVGPFMYQGHSGVRATQWTPGAKFDQSTIDPWVLNGMWL